MQFDRLLRATSEAGFEPDQVTLSVRVEYQPAGHVVTISGATAIEYTPTPRLVSLKMGQEEYFRLRFEGSLSCANPEDLPQDAYWSQQVVEKYPAAWSGTGPLDSTHNAWAWFSTTSTAVRIIAKQELGSPVRELPSLAPPHCTMARTVEMPLGPIARFVIAEQEYFESTFMDQDEAMAKDALYRMLTELPLVRANPCDRAQFDEMLRAKPHANLVDLANGYLRHLMHTGTPVKAPANAKLTPRIAAITNAVWRGTVLRAQTGGSTASPATDAGDFGTGLYFTGDPAIAKAYARGPIDQPDRGARINEHYLIIERPLVFKTIKEARAFRINTVGRHLVDKPQSTLAAAVIGARLRDSGFDGVVVYDGDFEHSSDADRPVEVVTLSHPPVSPPGFKPRDFERWEETGRGRWTQVGEHVVVAIQSIHPHGWLVEAHRLTPQRYRGDLVSSLVTSCAVSAADTARWLIELEADRLPREGSKVYDLRRDTRSLEQIGVQPGWFARSAACSIWLEVLSVQGTHLTCSARDPATRTSFVSQGLHYSGIDQLSDGQPDGQWIAGDGSQAMPRLKNFLDKFHPEPDRIVPAGLREQLAVHELQRERQR